MRKIEKRIVEMKRMTKSRYVWALCIVYKNIGFDADTQVLQ